MRDSMKAGSRARSGRTQRVVWGAGLGVAAILTAAVAATWEEAAPPAGNRVINGSFEDVNGLRETKYGFKGELPGWTGSLPHVPELVRHGTVGMPAAEGEYWLDTGESRANVIDISQRIEGLTPGTMLRLAFRAGQWREPSDAPDETLNVYWGGALLGTVRPEIVGGYETFEFEVVAGAGDGSDTLRFEGVSDGSSDHQGVVLDDVRLFETGLSGGGETKASGG